MKTKLTALVLALTSSFAFGHGDIELGPNGGRIVEFSKDESMHGEVTVKDGKFHVALLDKEKKPVALGEQTLTVTGGDRNNPEKLAVEKKGQHFVAPAVKSGQWVILQYRENPKAKAVTARFEYDTSVCGECSKQEWLCACGAEEAKKK
ncbi:MAG: hypothetical protein EOP84_16215 [Verrucomicrobiaceae bacterium]|nr:MAG: hypothetical protein EOP84_16215 [Verrucomicrobiaceae bacterium]